MIGLLIAFSFIYPLRYDRIMNYNLLSMIFCIIVVLLSMKVSFQSKILIYFGNMLFWIYILQRIPMALIKHHQITNNTCIQVFLSLGVTLVLAYLMNELSKKLKQVLFKP